MPLSHVYFHYPPPPPFELNVKRRTVFDDSKFFEFIPVDIAGSRGGYRDL